MKIKIIILSLCLLLVSLACQRDASRIMGYKGEVALEKPSEGGRAVPASEPQSAPSPALPQEKRKIMTTTDVDVEVKNVREASSQIKTKAQEVGGYVLNQSMWGAGEENSQKQQGAITVRIPPEKLEEMLSFLLKLGTIKKESTFGQDVTEDYYDIQSRLKNAQRTEETYLELLKNAKAINDILAINKELEISRERIESLQGKINFYNTRVDSVTVNVNLYEPQTYTALKPNMLTPLKEALSHSLEAIVVSISALIVFLAYFLPWAIILCIVIFIIRKIVRRKHKKQESKKETKEA